MKIRILLIFVFQTLLLFGHASTADKAKIQLSFFKKDTLRQVKAIVMKAGMDKSEHPVKDIEVHFYVQRSYGLLSIGGDYTTTDDNGEATIYFPKDLPGDSLGNVMVIAKVEDSDELDNMEIHKTVNWGIATVNKSLDKRALWAAGSRAPLSLVIAINTAMAGIWGVIIYIVIQLFKISKIGKYEKENQS